MFKTKTNIAILLFANSSQHEASEKSMANSSILFEHLNEKTLQKAQKTGLDVIISTEKEQVGNNFSQRFTNAISDVFEKGYNSVITIGNDSPDLTVVQLLKAQENLENNIATLGPSLDGGTYLIAISKEEFNEQQFASLPWQSSQLFTSLKYLLKETSQVAVFAYLKDIDTLSDLQYFLHRSIKKTTSLLHKIIHCLISNHKTIQYYNFKETLPSTSLITKNYNKGSPLFSPLYIFYFV